MPIKTPMVSVIIPHWNGIEILSECLDSLRQATYSNLEIIVVDNASTDGSPDWIRLHHSEVILVENDHNYGYAGGCNRGLKIARGDYLVFLNNDTIQDSGWLEPLVDFLNKNPDVGAVQPKILNYYKRNIFDYAGGAGGWLDVLAFPFARGRMFTTQEEDRGQYNQKRPVFWASGTAMLVRKADFLAAGGFDESFFAHMEEIDLCWRLHLMGKEVWALPQSCVYHKNAASLPMFSRQKQYLNHRNSLLMLLSNYTLPLTLYLFPLRYFLDWVAVGYALLRFDFNHFLGILQAHFWILTHPKIIWKRRGRVSLIRRKSDRYILDILYKGSVVLNYYLLGKKKSSDLIEE